jgi:hypothetical protein
MAILVGARTLAVLAVVVVVVIITPDPTAAKAHSTQEIH